MGGRPESPYKVKLEQPHSEGEKGKGRRGRYSVLILTKISRGIGRLLPDITLMLIRVLSCRRILNIANLLELIHLPTSYLPYLAFQCGMNTVSTLSFSPRLLHQSLLDDDLEISYQTRPCRPGRHGQVLHRLLLPCACDWTRSCVSRSSKNSVGIELCCVPATDSATPLYEVMHGNLPTSHIST